MSDGKLFLKQIAPTLATFLFGPAGGVVAEIAGKALGMDTDDLGQIRDAVRKGELTGEQIAALRQAEIQAQAKEKELGIRFEELAVKDRADARAMQVSTRSMIPGLLAMVVTSGFFGILWMLMSGEAVKSDALMLMLGSLGTAWTSIIAFFFGSSVSSQGKDEMIYKSTPTK